MAAVRITSLTGFAQIGGAGWTRRPLTFNVQWPYDVPEDTRYWFTNGVYHCLVYSNDAPFKVDTTTLPRTEQRFTPDYTNGEIQYQATLKVPGDENSFCVFQIHTGNAQSSTYGSTTFMLFWFSSDGGSVHDYSGTELANNLADQWFQLNVDHNLNTRTIKVWLNQKLVWTQQDNGAEDFYFKDGVYEQHHHATYRMDAYLTNILMWTSSGSPVVPLVWAGQTNGVNVSTWDLGLTKNWLNASNGAAEFYQDGSSVTFDDSASGATTVDLQTLLHPSRVTVSNTVKNYTFTRSGGLGGSATLMKYGDGTLTVDTVNNFTGGVVISGGTLRAGNAAALGEAGGGVLVSGGGTLDVNGFALSSEPVTVSGSGVGGNGAIINSGGQQTSALRNVTLAGDTTFGGTGRWDIRNSVGTASVTTSPPGSPFNLVKVGTNQVSLVGVTLIDPALGTIAVRQGTFAVQTSTGQLGDPNKTLTVAGGATLDLWTLTASPLNKRIMLAEGATVFNEKGPSVVIGPTILEGDATFNVAHYGAPPALTVSNEISGSGGLNVTGGGDLILAGVNAYTGATTVGQGTLSLAGSGSISDSAIIRVAAGAALDASGRGDGALAVADGQMLTGGGTIAGNVIVGGGATLEPSGAATTLTFQANLALRGGSTTAMELNRALSTNGVVQVAGTLTYDGTLLLTNVAGTLADGDSFKLFDAGTYRGAFTQIAPAIPALNLAWNTNTLASDGTLRIVSAPTPPPQISRVSAAGGSLAFSGTNGVPGWPVYVLASTNLALPVAQWTPLASNVFDGHGQFSFTNSIGRGTPREFYRLQLP